MQYYNGKLKRDGNGIYLAMACALVFIGWAAAPIIASVVDEIANPPPKIAPDMHPNIRMDRLYDCPRPPITTKKVTV